MLDNYKMAFPDYNESYDVLVGKGKINEFLAFMKKTLINLKNFHETISKTVEKREFEIEKYIELIKNFKEYESNNILSYSNEEEKLVFANSNNNSISEKIDKLKDLLLNPYVILEIWIEEEKLDIDAMITVIGSLNKLQENLDKLNQKNDSLDLELKKTESGQPSFFKKLFKKKEEIITDISKEKENTEENIQNLSDLIKIATYALENYIQQFRQDKVNNYFRHLKIFILLQRKNDKNITGLWADVKQSLSQVPLS